MRGATASRRGESRGASDRPTLVAMLHNELLRYPKNELIMQAWLSVVHWEDGQQRSLLADASNPALFNHASNSSADH